MSTSPTSLSAHVADLVERVSSAVVTVISNHGAASGTVIGPGRIVMANHGLDPEADGVRVAHAHGAADAKVVGRDPTTDIALLATDDSVLKPIDSAAERPRVGSVVASVGRARDRVVAGFGIIHAHFGPVARRHGGRIDALLATTIVPYPGFSGGPVLDVSGPMVGLATAGLQRGAGLAVPIDLVMRTVDVLLAHGRIRRGFLGVTSLGVELPAAQHGSGGPRTGLLVTSVASSGPASQAGLMVGDVVIAIDNQGLRSVEDLMTFLTGDVISRTVPLSIMRGPQPLSLTITVAERGAASHG